MPHFVREPSLFAVFPRTIAWLTSASLLFGVQVDAFAAPPTEPAEAPESDTAKAESIFRRGQAKYETADYVGAIELWTEAYGLVESTPENAAIKALLIFNLAQAHVKAFELDEDAIHLKQARSLLDSYSASLELLYEEGPARAEEQAKVDEKLAEIAEKLDEVEAAESKREPRTKPDAEPKTEPEPDFDVPPPTPGNPLMFAGAGVTVFGVAAGSALMTLGGVLGTNANDVSGLDPLDLAAREEQFARGQRGNGLLVTGAIVAGLLIPVGIGLIAVGARRNAEARNARARLPGLAPGFGPGQAGLVLRGRF